VANTSEVTLRPPSGTRVPIGSAAAGAPQPATTTATSSGSKRTISIESTPTSRPISSAIAPNTSANGICRATNVATRRNAACSSARTRILSWALALEIAVAISSVNS
jgi:hypothetical protein